MQVDKAAACPEGTQKRGPIAGAVGRGWSSILSLPPLPLSILPSFFSFLSSPPHPTSESARQREVFMFILFLEGETEAAGVVSICVRGY